MPRPERPRVRLGAYAALLAIVLLGALGAGRAVGPVGERPETAVTGSGPATPVRGLAATEAGFSIVVDEPVRPAGAVAELRFRIVAPDGTTVRDYDRLHGRELHLIVVRRDLTGYQHVHPEMDHDGTWQTRLRLDEPGVHRAYADVRPAGGPALTLAADLTAPGPLTPRPLPAPTATARVDGYDVALRGRPVAGRAGTLTFSFSRGGAPVTDLEPYLEARGHLVALRASDLAYLHVHPEDEPSTGADVRFTVAFPAAGPHRLFLDFRHEGVVRTAAVTVDVPRDPDAAPAHEGTSGHDDGHGGGG